MGILATIERHLLDMTSTVVKRAVFIDALVTWEPSFAWTSTSGSLRALFGGPAALQLRSPPDVRRAVRRLRSRLRQQLLHSRYAHRERDPQLMAGIFVQLDSRMLSSSYDDVMLRHNVANEVFTYITTVTVDGASPLHSDDTTSEFLFYFQRQINRTISCGLVDILKTVFIVLINTAAAGDNDIDLLDIFTSIRTFPTPRLAHR